MVLKQFFLLLAIGYLTTAVFALECEHEVMVKCENATCDCGENDTHCAERQQIECYNGAACYDGCECNPCWSGDQCTIPLNPNAPQFVEEADTLELEEAVLDIFPNLHATDDDGIECNPEEYEHCNCSVIRYGLEDDMKGVFEINPENGNLFYHPNITTDDEYVLKISAFNPVEGDEKKTLTKVPVKILKKLPASEQEDPDQSVVKSQPADEKGIAASVGDAVDSLVKKAGDVKNNLIEAFEEISEKVIESTDDTAEGKVVTPQKTGPRKVKMFTIAGDKITRNDVDENGEHKRVKRGTAGVGVPDEYAFTLEAQNNAAQEFRIGETIQYKLTIHASSLSTEMQVEIFSEITGGAYFMISNVRITHVGSNFVDFIAPDKEVKYNAKFNDGRWDIATIDMGTINNNVTDAINESASQIEIQFEVQAQKHGGLVVDETHRLSVGITYQGSSFITVAQDDLAYKDYDTNVQVDAHFSLSGPTELGVGFTGVWTINCSVYDLWSIMSLDVLAPISSPGAMRIDRISVVPDQTGEFYRYAAISDDGTNFTRTQYEDYGDYARLDIGTILNSGYHDNNPNNDVAKSQILFEVAITMLDVPDVNLTDPYRVGFTMWRKDMNDLEIMWSSQSEVQAVKQNVSNMLTTPSFELSNSVDEVEFNGVYGVLLNMSLPALSSSLYNVELSLPVNDSLGSIHFERVRLSKIGFNLPHLQSSVNDAELTTNSTDGTYVDYAKWSLGLIDNTDQRNGPDDNTVQVEFALRITENAEQFYAIDDEIFVTVGVEHGGIYYWVGRIGVVLKEAGSIIYDGEQVPEFSLNNAMGIEAHIFPESAGVFDLDMFVPAGINAAPVTVDFTTPVGNLSGMDETQFKVLSFEIVHVGAALLVVTNESATQGLSGYGDADADGVALMGKGIIQFERIVNLQPVDYARYKWSDSTIRLRVVVIARNDSQTLVADELYYTEFAVVMTTDYIFAGRIGVYYNTTQSEMYVGRDWQPTISISLIESLSSNLPIGGAAVFDVDIGVPYQTVTDITLALTVFDDNIQVCDIRRRTKGGALVNYDTSEYTGIPRIIRNSNDTAYKLEHDTPLVSSYGYGIFTGNELQDSYVSYQVSFMVTDSALVNASYSASVGAVFGGSTFLQESPSFYTIEPTESSYELPDITIGHMGSTSKINIGSFELFYLDIYVPPGNNQFLHVSFLAPWNNTFYGQYEILEAHLISNGKNVPCSIPQYTSFTVNSTSDNLSGRPNIAEARIPAPNVADGGDLVHEDNLIRLVAMIGVSADTTLDVGDVVPIAASVKIGHDTIWVGYADTTVVAAGDTENVYEPSELPTITVERNGGPSMMEIGSERNYTAEVFIPGGSALSEAKLIIESPVDGDSAYMHISDVVIKSGSNLNAALMFSESIIENSTVGQQYSHQTTFNLLRNSDLSNIKYGMNYQKKDDILLITFNTRLHDHLDLIDHFKFNITVRLEWTTETVDATGDTEVETLQYENDNAAFDWSVVRTDDLENVRPQSAISFKLNIGLSDVARRFPDAVSLNFRAPEFSRLDSIDAEEGLTGTMPQQNSASGVQFKWDTMKYGDKAEVNFTLTLDPLGKIKPALYFRYIQIPMDVTFERENKTDPGTYDSWFTEMKVLSFEIFIPECLEGLGLQDGRVLDCQITASSENPDFPAINSRFNETDGWQSLPRGPPYYQNEFIQVDFPTSVKFTGMTIQPNNDLNLTRPVTFKVKYSREGIRWEDALDDGMQPKTFTITWANDPPAVYDYSFIPFGNMTFIGKHIRILPQTSSLDETYQQSLRFEVHGCTFPYGTEMASYTCPTTEADLLPRVERQWLTFNSTKRMFVCILDMPGGEPYCSGTDDPASGWFVMDDNLMNLVGSYLYFNEYKNYELNYVIYGIARNRKSYLRSDDLGATWVTVAVAEVDDAKSEPTWINAQEIKFSDTAYLSHDAVKQNFNSVRDDGKFVTVSKNGIQVITDVAAASEVDGIVAYWGTGNWDGP